MSSSNATQDQLAAKEKLSNILDDLLVRFIINSPINELACMERLGFLIELAYWFYEDIYFESDPQKHILPKIPNLKAFALILYEHCPEIFPYTKANYSTGSPRSNFEEQFSKFLKYKSSIPVVGAILIDQSEKFVSFCILF